MKTLRFGICRLSSKASLFALLAPALISTSCSTIDYTPNANLTGDLRGRLRERLLTATFPEVKTLEVQDRFYAYRASGISGHVNFGEVDYIEVYDNEFVFLRAADDAVLDKVRFETEEEAKDFADLVTSLRAQVGAGQIPAGPREADRSTIDSDAIK